MLENKKNLTKLLQQLTVDKQAELLMKISDHYENYIELESGWVVSDHLKYEELGKFVSCNSYYNSLGTQLEELKDQGLIYEYLDLGNDFYAYKKSKMYDLEITEEELRTLDKLLTYDIACEENGLDKFSKRIDDLRKEINN